MAHSLSRRNLMKSLAMGAGAATFGKLANAAPAEKPNVVLILADDLGYGDLSSYGAPDLHSPRIDALMDAGMRFDNFYANCPVCSPTRASVLSGRYPDLVGVPGVIRTHWDNSWGYLSKDAVLLPRVLKKAGYHSAIVGKWHLGLEPESTPIKRGFDHFHGFLGDMMDDYYHHRRHENNYMRLDEEIIDPPGHATDLFTPWAVEYIRERAKTKEPFFLYLPYNAPHAPIQPPQDWLERVLAREKGIDAKRAALVALIEHLDNAVGRVEDALHEAGVADNTLLIFTSDNGGQSSVGANNGPLHGGKQEMWEGGLRVPMCAVWPGKIKAGSRSDRVALTMDLYPSICEAAGVRFDHEIDGRSILPTWLGEKQPEEDRTLFWVRREGGRQYGGQEYYAARKGDWKLLQNTPFEPYQLFNLKDDPKEEHPLPDNHRMYGELFNAIKEQIIKAGAVPWEK